MQLPFKKVIVKDSILNILASLILTIATQVLVYPYLANKFTILEYGIILTLIGIVNTVGVSLGNSLNNTRILLQPDYNDSKVNGDYNLIFLFLLIIGAILTGVISIILLKKIDIIVIGCIIITILLLFRSYFSASFRIEIDYKKILITNIWAFLGYIVGIVIVKFTDIWVYTFIFGELFACIYIFFTSKIIHDKFQITVLFKKSFIKYTYIMSAAFLTNAMMYMDRFFLYPFLGADKVTTYTVASFIGKSAGILMNPIAGVLLTYYVKEVKITIKQFYKRIGLFSIVSMVIYIFILLLGIPITKMLYPSLVDNVLPYFYVGNLAAILFILGSTIQPTLLRFCHAKWQLIIQVTYFLSYFIFGYFGIINFELIGFVYGILIANFIRILLMITIVSITILRTSNE